MLEPFGRRRGEGLSENPFHIELSWVITMRGWKYSAPSFAPSPNPSQWEGKKPGTVQRQVAALQTNPRLAATAQIRP
jgi:hypothetical protein